MIASRGPDEVGELSVDSALFGHRRLSIIGLGEVGSQPMAADPDHVLVYNGEIYNYQDLARQLGIKALSDTEVLYEIGRRREWSTWIHRLRGMYAFVHYDRRDETITYARDPFGIKPLFLRNDGEGNISIASTVAALARLGTPAAPDPVALSGFLALGLFPAGSSAFENIEKIDPGTLTQLHRMDHGWAKNRFEISGSEWPSLPVPDALADSVDAHLVADVEVGVLLSGGVDSTLLAAIASRLQPGVRTFCLTNPDHPDIDEGGFARHNAALLGTTHIEVPVSPATLAERASALIATVGEPFGDAAYLPLSALSEEVARHVKVALAGEGADELFRGYRRYDIERVLDAPLLGDTIRLGGRLARLQDRIPAPASQRDRALHASALAHPADRHAALMFADWKSIRRAFPGGEEAHSRFLASWNRAAADPWALGQPPNRAFDTREWLPNVFLEKSDRASMQHSLELRTPYLDPVVARSTRALRLRDTRKRPLREELFRLLPDVMLPARKKGLSVDIRSLVINHYAGLIRDTVMDTGSVLSRIGLKDRRAFQTSAEASPALAFRVAMVGLWQDAWL